MATNDGKDKDAAKNQLIFSSKKQGGKGFTKGDIWSELTVQKESHSQVVD